MKAKKILSVILSTVILMLGCIPAFAADEIPEGYTPIYNAEDLDNIRNNPDGNYILMNHINLSEIESWEPIGTYDAPFTGKLEGNGFSVVNMKTYEGLFDRVNSAVISNLGIVECMISLSEDEASNACVMGAVAGQSNNSVFENCFVTGKIYPKISVGLIALATFCNAGGLVGVSKNSTFTDCYNTADIHFTYDKISSAELGGLVGAAINTAIKNCYNSGFVSSEKEDRYSSGEKNVYIGGLVGEADENTLFTSCYFSDEIKVADGRNSSTPSGAEMLSDSQMKMKESYLGFDFENVWKMEENGYPILINELKTANVLVSAEAIYIPLKNRLVFSTGAPNSPAGIVLRLTYSDGTEEIETVKFTENGFFAGDETVKTSLITDLNFYGINKEILFVGDSMIQVEYKYLALPPIIRIIFAFLRIYI